MALEQPLQVREVSPNRSVTSSTRPDRAVVQHGPAAVTALVGRYPVASAPGGRPHRVVIAVHPHIGREDR
jgi:hypothetical protein